MKKINNILKTILGAKAVYLIAVGILFSLQASAQQPGSGVVLPQNTGLPNPPGGFATILEGLVKWLLLVFGFLALISFIISGIMYLMAGGDDKTAEKAKKQMQWSIIGVIVGLSGFIVINAVTKWLGGSVNF